MTKKGDSASGLTLCYVNGKLTVEPIPQSEKKPLCHPLAEALNDFMQRIDDVFFAAKVMVPASIDILDRRVKKVNKTIDNARTVVEAGLLEESSHAGATIIEASYEAERLNRSKLPEIVERSLFVNLFAEYDHFFGVILRELYKRRPDLLASLSKQISFDELLKFESIESVKASVLESEIESVRRESYVEQFSILQRKFGLPLTKFQDWPCFVEAAQRRNLMVHCGGHISEQYLSMCDATGYKFSERPKIGERLSVGYPYFERTANLVARVGFMLTHTLWSKVLPAERAQANDELNDQLYKLLCAKRWGLAAELGAFSLGEQMMEGATEIQYRIRLCNTAIALKNLKKVDEMRKLLSTVDWSASIRDFRLAVRILEDDYDGAAQIMKQIGERGELVHEVAYHQWPLFAIFRERPEFQAAYEEIYGFPFYVKAEKTVEAARSRRSASPDAAPTSDDVPKRSSTLGRTATNTVKQRAASTKKGTTRKREPISKNAAQANSPST